VDRCASNSGIWNSGCLLLRRSANEVGSGIALAAVDAIRQDRK
jgi:hypothetical protein